MSECQRHYLATAPLNRRVLIRVGAKGRCVVAVDRRLEVLRAIVEDYVQTREPVGSRSLVERHALGVSPATIRNDMAVLEEGGYIAQPHTSAGRIPTDLGYRLFVDQLQNLKPMSAPERRAIEHFLDSSVDLDDVVHRTVRLLAQLTGQVAVVQYPSLRRSSVRHVELVESEHGRILVIVITDTGRVEQRVVDAERPVDAAVIAELRARLNAAAVGRPLTDLGEDFAALPETFELAHRELVRTILDVVTQTLAVEGEERIVLAGTANLARSGTDFVQSISPVLEALEEQVVLLKLLTSMDEEPDHVTVVIGRENQHAGLSETSLVSAGYGGASDVVARLGVLGPLRMNYPTTITAVRAVASYVSTILGE